MRHLVFVKASYFGLGWSLCAAFWGLGFDLSPTLLLIVTFAMTYPVGAIFLLHVTEMGLPLIN